jgi:hypothetical protein
MPWEPLSDDMDLMEEEQSFASANPMEENTVSEDAAPLPPTAPDPIEVNRTILSVIKEFEEDDRSAHEVLSQECRKYELYWQNIQDIIWDSSSRDWVSASGVLQHTQNLDIDPSILDKTIGIYRSYGEIVAAALSTTTPTVRFPPADADSGADLVTARTSNAISDLIQKNNDAQLLFLKALYTKFNQHFVAAYHTVIVDDAYGTVKRPKFGVREEMVPTGMQICPDCGAPRTSIVCETCGSASPEIPEMAPEQVPFVDKILQAPKGRVRIEIFGPRQVKVQPNCREVSDSPYLVLESDLHETKIKELYPEFNISSGGTNDDVRTIDRRPTTDLVDTRKIHTLKRCWLRPWAFSTLPNEDMRIFLKTSFPDGVFITYCEDQVLDINNESLDDFWTFLRDPFAEYIHGDPRGKFLIPLQDMFNDTEMLALETILHNIPEMFADPRVLNFKNYSEKEGRPGQVNQAVAPEGMNLAAGFYQPQGATLSKEVDIFLGRLQELAQFVVGAPPSIWGGESQGGSGTLGEYQQSRAQAQQRLSTDWKMLNKWWAKIMTKCVKLYREFMKQLAMKVQDPVYAEKFVQKSGENYINIWIRLEEMTGEVGEAEAESSDQFPVSWEQQRGLLFELLQVQHPIFQGILSNPENIGTVRDILGMYKLKIPGEQDRDKQLAEIQQMLIGSPVMVEQVIDNHQVHWATVASWANSITGRDIKLTNPMGYQLVMQHALQHQMIMLAQMQPPEAGQGQAPSEGPAEKQGSSERPDTGGAKGEPPR